MNNKEIEVYGEENTIQMYNNDNIELFEKIAEGREILVAFEEAVEQYIDSQITTTIEILRQYEKQELSFDSNMIIKQLSKQIESASHFLSQGFSLFLTDYARSKKINVQKHSKPVSSFSEEEYYVTFFRKNIINHCNYITNEIDNVHRYCKIHNILLTEPKQKTKGGK